MVFLVKDGSCIFVVHDIGDFWRLSLSCTVCKTSRCLCRCELLFRSVTFFVLHQTRDYLSEFIDRWGGRGMGIQPDCGPYLMSCYVLCIKWDVTLCSFDCWLWQRHSFLFNSNQQ